VGRITGHYLPRGYTAINPTPQETDPTYEEGIYDDLQLSQSQWNFLNAEEQYVALVTGYGGGKTFSGMLWLLDLCQLYPRIPNFYGAPTYGLIRDIFYPQCEEYFTDQGIGYQINKSTNTVFIEGAAPIICRPLEEPEKLVGFQVGSALLDEFDIMKRTTALKVWQKVIARCRKRYPKNEHIVNVDGTPYNPRNRVAITTTPEGYRATYDLFYANPKPNYRLIQGSTYENAQYLPDDYIEGLLSTYPENLVDAYINGQFVNLTSGSVYPRFDRMKNGSDATVDGNEPILVGTDFNVLYGAAVIHVLRDGYPVAVDEIHNSFDTDETIAALIDKYPANPITVYPDATGDTRTSANTTMSDIRKLKEAKFRVKKPSQNPNIKDRVAAMNALILNGKGQRRYKVNAAKCPNLVASLEQQTYNDAGQPDKDGGLDHIVDAAGYFVNYQYGLTKPKAAVTTVKGGY
jgi:hypothetical protein